MTSPGNQVDSPTLAATNDLKVGRTSGSAATASTCGEYSDTTVAPMRFLSNGTVGSTGTLSSSSTVGQFDNFCLLNAGTAPLVVTGTFLNVVSTDLGCGPGEATSSSGPDAADANCASGGAGELNEIVGGFGQERGVLNIGVVVDSVNNGSLPFGCWTMTCGLTNASRRFVTLQPGQTAVLFFTFTWSDAVNGAGTVLRTREASQSDRLVWDIRFDAEPA